jgi:peptide/nickel transport system substrate-binding protein
MLKCTSVFGKEIKLLQSLIYHRRFEMYKFLRFTLIMVIIAIMLSACAPATPEVTEAPTEAVEAPAAAPPTEAPDERGTFRFAHQVGWGGKESFDPVSPVRWDPAIQFIYDRLVRRDENGMPIPRLAVSWEADATAQRWTFKLREGVTFHDGKPFTSADVAYTFKHIFDPELESPLAAVLELVDIEALETPDDLTIVFNLKSGHADFTLLLTDYRARVIPEGSLDTIEENPIGTGPFKLKRADIYGTSVFVANDDYWDGKPGLARIELIGIADMEARVQSLLAGQTDWLFGLSPEQTALFEGNLDYTIMEVPTGDWRVFVMNVNEPPFDDVRVRQALKLIVDRQEMMDVVLQGHGSIACDHPVWPGDLYHLKLECSQDIEKAKELLAQAGYSEGLTVELVTSDIQPELIPMAVVYKDQAAEAGINVEIKQVPSDGYWSDHWMVDPFVMSSWAQRPADQVLNEAFRCEASWNESYWCNDEFVQALDEARKELDLAKRTELYHRAQQLLAEDGGSIIPFFKNGIEVMAASVKGIPPIEFDGIPWEKIYIEE